MDATALVAILEPRETRVRPVLQEQPGVTELPEHRVHRDRRELKVLREPLVPLVLKVPPELQVPLVPPEPTDATA